MRVAEDELSIRALEGGVEDVPAGLGRERFEVVLDHVVEIEGDAHEGEGLSHHFWTQLLSDSFHLFRRGDFY